MLFSSQYNSTMLFKKIDRADFNFFSLNCNNILIIFTVVCNAQSWCSHLHLYYIGIVIFIVVDIFLSVTGSIRTTNDKDNVEPQ